MIDARRRSASRAAAAVLGVTGILAFVGSGCAHPPAPSAFPGSPRTTAVRQLDQDLSAIVSAPDLVHSSWGIAVRSIETGDVLYSFNPEKLLVPASNMKVVTLAAAAEKLGWDFAYETRLLTAGQVADSILSGDLIVAGSGDPSIDDWDGQATRLFDDWATQLKTAGIQTIAGRLIGDDNAFEDDGLGAGWAWDDLAASYATGTGGLQFDENTARLTVVPAAVTGDSPTITVAPEGSGLAIHSSMQTGASGSPVTMSVRRAAGSANLELRGSVPAGGERIVRNVSVVNPTLYFVTALRQAMIRNGISVRGDTVDIDDVGDVNGADARPLIVHRSPPLSDLAQTMMKNSQNLYAETLLKTVGGRGAATASTEAGRAAVRDILSSWGIGPGDIVIADGSGLSRYNLVTADALVAILSHVEHDERLREHFEASFPVAGVDGTFGERLKGTPAQGVTQVKSGSMSNVRAACGYVRSSDGDRLAFAIIVNNYAVNAAVVEKATDAIIARLASFSLRR